MCRLKATTKCGSFNGFCKVYIIYTFWGNIIRVIGTMQWIVLFCKLLLGSKLGSYFNDLKIIKVKIFVKTRLWSMTVYVCESFNISIQYTCKYPNYSYNYQVWVAYKESSWIYAVIWVILLICFGRLVHTISWVPIDCWL
jgi:hypothetical protein